MKKVIRLTESDLVRLVKRVISEQTQNPGFYDELEKKGYKMNQIWRNDENLSSQIKPVLKSLKPENERYVVYFEKDLTPGKSIRFITDGANVYFLNNQYGDGRLEYFSNGPHTLNTKLLGEF